MVSRYKLKIISWYTSLLSGIMIAVFILLYFILGYQLRQEIDGNLLEKNERIDNILLETDESPPCDRSFYKYIVGKRYYDFYDIREYTDVVDDKYILFVYCGDSLMYLSRKYENLKVPVSQFQIKKNNTPTIDLLDRPFSMSAIYKVGYTVYVGYELSTIRSVQRQILRIFLLVFPFGVLLSILCGYYVTQRSLKVIHTITDTAGRITSKRLDERIPIPSDKDEITQLIMTLNSMVDRLEKSFIMVQQFSHDAAHEIRTPLTIVRGELEELLKEDQCPENVTNTIESLLEEIQYLSSIADKLLLIHSLDTGKIEYHFTEVNLKRILEDIVEDARVLSAQKNLSIELEESENIFMRGNEELLIRLMWNLIDNAVKYTAFEGKVTLSLQKYNSMAILTVKDTGIGVPEEDIPKIFDRFYRVDKSRSRKLGGSGLGLAICKWIVELHHGEIHMESEANKGSQFKVILPITVVT